MATIVSSSPSAVTRTPVRTGRASSREAARATRSIVSCSASAGSSTGSPSDSGKRGKSSAGRVRRWKLRGAGGDLDVALGLAQLERHRPVGERAGDLDQQPAGQDDGAGALDLALEADVEAELHVGGAQAGLAVGGDQDPGERLEGGAGGDGAGDDEERVEQGLVGWL